MFVRQVITAAIAAGILLVQAPGLIRRRLWGELWTCAGLTLTAAALLILDAAGVEMPSLLKWLTIVIRPWGKAWLGWLGE